MESVILKSVLAGASPTDQQLLTEPSLSLAVDLFRSILGRLVTYNLDAIQQIAQTTANCSSEPELKSRRIIEKSRDDCFACLRTFENNNRLTSTEYVACLQQISTVAKSEVDALKPIIDACLASVSFPVGGVATNTNAGTVSQTGAGNVGGTLNGGANAQAQALGSVVAGIPNGNGTTININVLVNALAKSRLGAEKSEESVFDEQK